MLRNKTETTLKRIGAFFTRTIEDIKMERIEKEFLKKIPKFPQVIIEKAGIEREDNVSRFVAHIRTIYFSKPEETFKSSKKAPKAHTIPVIYPQLHLLKPDKLVWLEPVSIVSTAYGFETIEYRISFVEITLLMYDQKLQDLRKEHVSNNSLNIDEDWSLVMPPIQKAIEEEKTKKN